MQPEDFVVPTLGECRFDSPLRLASPTRGRAPGFVSDEVRIRWHTRICPENAATDHLNFEEAGPRESIYFDPPKTTGAVVTCGGLSPGLNNVIRSLYVELVRNYGVARVLGIRNGYLGLNPQSGLEPILLSREVVDPIDRLGGTILGTSRGPQDPAVMADFLQARGIDLLFCLGGDGTQRGAHALSQELRRRGAAISVIGIPKTIDNDIPFVRLSFGYATALEKAAEVIHCAHAEARGAINGIGLVKLMGRHSGMIAAGATVVAQEVNFTLVPEIPFPLDGEDGLLAVLERRMKERGHAVIVVAEGAGQHLFPATAQQRDASGNIKFQDIGIFLRDQIVAHFGARKLPINVRYFDPSYHIRSVPADSYDRYISDQMARHAVHAAMAGKTGILIGFEHEHFVHIPIPAVVTQKKEVDLGGDLWRAVLQVTGQPHW